MAPLARRRGGLAPETQHFEEEEPHPVWAFAQLRRLGLGLVTVSHANLVGLIRIPRPFIHTTNATGEQFLSHSISALPGCLRSPLMRRCFQRVPAWRQWFLPVGRPDPLTSYYAYSVPRMYARAAW
jgi:hypothetical protein